MADKEVLEKIEILTRHLDMGMVHADDIEAVTALRNGMQYGVDILRIREYDSGNSRRQAIMEQRARHTQ